jgi:hypothetical protein
MAATINVVPDGVSGCRLRQAFQAANTDLPVSPCPAGSGTDTLVLQQFDNRPTFTLSGVASGDVLVSSAIVVQGVDPERSMIVALDFDRAFDVTSGSLTLNDVTVVGGSIAGASDNDGGVLRKGAGATLTVNRSVLRNGNADLGGAVYAIGAGVLTLDKVTVTGNNAVFGGGVALQQGTGVEAVLNNVTISGNNASASGGGLYANSWVRLRNSTVARNRSAGVGGVHYAGTINTTGVNFANSVFTENVNGNGDGSDLYCSGTTGNNQLGARTHTLITALSNCTFASFSGTPASGDARIAPLFDFGSGRPTHALLAGSAALGAGNPSNANPLTSCLSSDARGVSRPLSCDLGAYEERFDAIVNSFSDFPDLNPGDGVCQALGNVCTLRAVVMEASASHGRWFVQLPAGNYVLTRSLNGINDADGGDLDVENDDFDLPPLQVTLFGMGDADDTQIIGGGFDRVLEVRGRDVVGPQLEFVHNPLAFALLNATVRDGHLTQDPFNFDPNSRLDGGGIQVIGAKSLFYNVVVRDNHAGSNIEEARGGGVYLDIRANSFNTNDRPYIASVRMERFAVVDNITDSTGGQNHFVGGIDATSEQPFNLSDGIVLTNGIIAGNQSRNIGGLQATGTTNISFLSIVGNVSGPLNPPGFTQYPGGLFVGGQSNVVRNVLIAGNVAGAENSDCEVFSGGVGDTLVSLGHNLIATAGSGCVISGDIASNLLNVNPQLQPRTLSSGGMPMYRPQSGSPAIDAVPLNACADIGGYGVAADAVGVPRPGYNNSSCDIGAIESELPLFSDGFE